MPATPNPKVTIPGSGVLLHVLNPSGEPVPVSGDADGNVGTTGGGGGGGGTVDQGAAGATSWKVVEDNSAAIKTAVESINSKATNDPATATSVQAVVSALGTPLQEGGNVVVTGLPGSVVTDQTNVGGAVVGAATWNSAGPFTAIASDSQLIVLVNATQSGTLLVDFSADGATVDITRSIATTANTGTVQPFVPIAAFVRIRWTNGSGSSATLRLQTLRRAVAAGPLFTRISDAITDTTPSNVTRSVLVGQNEGSLAYKNVPADPDGHLEVRIAAPITAFGQVAVTESTPVAQVDFATNEILSEVMLTHFFGSATAPTAANGMLAVATSANANSMCRAFTRRPVKYAAGAGGEAAFTMMFTTPAANSEQWAGAFNPECGLVFGYSGTTFGLNRFTGGKREVRTLTITTNSNTAENVTVTLNGSAKLVAVTASGANSAASRLTTALQIAAADYSATGTGWDAYCVGASNPTVVFVSRVASVQTGTYSLTGTTVVGSFAQSQAGVAVTNNFVPAADFNIDKLNGTKTAAENPSGMLIDPLTLNVARVTWQYLGAGGILYEIENPANRQFSPVHLIKYANVNTTPSLNAPTLHVGAMVVNTSNTSNLIVRSASLYGAIQGQTKLLQLKRDVARTQVSLNSASYLAIWTIRNPLFVRGRTNYAVITISDISFGAITRDSDCALFLNSTLGGSPSFAAIDASTVLEYDQAGTTVTGGFEKWSASAPLGTSISRELVARQIIVLPGETLTFAAKNTGAGTVDCIIGYDEVQ